MYFKKNFYLLILYYLLTFNITFKADICPQVIEPDPIGNFSLPISQQPGCLFGFGQHVVEKGDFLLEAFTTQLRGRKKNTIIVDPYALYGITDDLSFLVNVPVFVKSKYNDLHSSGIGDILPVLEYAYYTKPTKKTYTQFTVVGGVTLAVGSDTKIPNTGFGSSAFFLGFTFAHWTQRFYCFGSIGTNQTTTNNNKTKFGSSYIYQFGGSVNLGDLRPGWIFALGCEFNGIYTQRDKITGAINSNSGGNVIFFGPSFFASNEKLIFQIGLQGTVFQHLFGVQNHNTYLFALNVGWKFN